MPAASIAIRLPKVRRPKRPPARLVYCAGWCAVCLFSLLGDTIGAATREWWWLAFSALWAACFLFWRYLLLGWLYLYRRGFPLRPVIAPEWFVLVGTFASSATSVAFIVAR